MNQNWLKDFVTESNRIEGIHRVPTASELRATDDFLALDRVCMRDLANFVSVCARGAEMRLRPGMDVRVRNHRPPPGGPEIGYSLDNIVRRANDGADPFVTHIEYETLHPFMDGNGRSGRVLWAWMMRQQGREGLLRLGFLHAWYYQSLSDKRNP